MNQQDYDQLVNQTIEYVKAEMSSNDSSHDFHHIQRVRHLAKFIAITEGLTQDDQLIVELGALLHDLKDWKYCADEIAGADAARKFLSQENVPVEIIDQICHIIANIGFSKEVGTQNTPRDDDRQTITPFEVVQDADRLDALGAIGIARCLTYGGAKNNILYDPNISVREHLNEKEYKNGKSTTINHFPEKLFKLTDLMKTPTGKQIANHRHQLMVDYYQQFLKEWEALDVSPDPNRK